MIRLYFFWCISMLLPGLALSATTQADGFGQHIQVVTYNPDRLYRVMTSQGYTTAIQLASGEKILSVNIGDSSSWLVNVQDNILNLKPISSNPDTNMNVVTDRGTYLFFLTATSRDVSGTARKPGKDVLFLLRFNYADGSQTGLLSAMDGGSAIYNLHYSARGDRSTAPACVFDNGRFTFFDFGNRKDIPAIFSVDNNGYESLVNYHVQGQYIVVEMVGKQFTLRNGSQVATVFNDAPQS